MPLIPRQTWRPPHPVVIIWPRGGWAHRTGKFKLPMIRGPATSSVSRHRDFQELVKSNLDNWMCNIYFEVIRRPRYDPLSAESGTVP